MLNLDYVLLELKYLVETFVFKKQLEQYANAYLDELPLDVYEEVDKLIKGFGVDDVLDCIDTDSIKRYVKCDEDWTENLHEAIEKLREAHSDYDVVEEIMDCCDADSILENIDSYDIKSYLRNNADVEDYVSFEWQW